MAPLIIALYGILVLFASIYAYTVAPSRGRRADVWSAWSFLFPPAAFFLYRMPRRDPPRLRRRHGDDDDGPDILDAL